MRSHMLYIITLPVVRYTHTHMHACMHTHTHAHTHTHTHTHIHELFSVSAVILEYLAMTECLNR